MVKWFVADGDLNFGIQIQLMWMQKIITKMKRIILPFNENLFGY